jgi:hypothetical protein
MILMMCAENVLVSFFIQSTSFASRDNMIVPLNDAALKAAITRLKVGDRVSVHWRSAQAGAEAAWTTWEGNVRYLGAGRANVAFAEDSCKYRVIPNRKLQYGRIEVKESMPDDSADEAQDEDDDGEEDDESEEEPEVRVGDANWTSETVYLDPAKWTKIFGVKQPEARIEIVVGKMRERYRKGSEGDKHMVDDVMESIRQQMILSSQIQDLAEVPAFQASVRSLITRLELNRRRVEDRLSAPQLDALGRAMMDRSDPSWIKKAEKRAALSVKYLLESKPRISSFNPKKPMSTKN